MISADEQTLSLYLSGRLETEQRLELEQFLRANAAARRSLDALREEEVLLREALDARIEPSHRLGDKVLETLYSEERFRLHSLRNWRLRRQVLAFMGAAATIVLCLLLVKPRDCAGSALGGSGATLASPGGILKRLSKNTNFYVGDKIYTKEGQFVRLQLSNGVLLDIDECTNIKIEKGGKDPAIHFDQGRMGIDTTPCKEDFLLSMPQGLLRMAGGSLADAWLTGPSNARRPELFEPLSADKPSHSPDLTKLDPSTSVLGRSLVLTVFKGSTDITSDKLPDGLTVTDAHRCIINSRSQTIESIRAKGMEVSPTPITNNGINVHKINLKGSLVLDRRDEKSWHTMDNGPKQRLVMGLLEDLDFNVLGRRLNLMQEASPEIAKALNMLQAAKMLPDLETRAEKLAFGQRDLRVAYEPLVQGDERHDFGRMLEGLAHLCRGRALYASLLTDKNNAAYPAFYGADVAFNDALKPFHVPGATFVPEDPVIALKRSLNTDATPVIQDLSASDQTRLMALFFRPIARYWQLQIKRQLPVQAAEFVDTALNLAREFAALREILDHNGRPHDSIESLAAHLGEGLAYNIAGHQDKALEAFEEVLAISLAGCPDLCRQYGDGLKQTALIAMVKLHVARGEMQKAENAIQDFWILYPLDASTPAGLEIQAMADGMNQKL